MVDRLSDFAEPQAAHVLLKGLASPFKATSPRFDGTPVCLQSDSASFRWHSVCLQSDSASFRWHSGLPSKRLRLVSMALRLPSKRLRVVSMELPCPFKTTPRRFDGTPVSAIRTRTIRVPEPLTSADGTTRTLEQSGLSLERDRPLSPLRDPSKAPSARTAERDPDHHAQERGVAGTFADGALPPLLHIHGAPCTRRVELRPAVRPENRTHPASGSSAGTTGSGRRGTGAAGRAA